MINAIIGITGCNRKYYSSALLTSINKFIDEYSKKIKLTCIYVDNGSTEPGLIEMLNEFKSKKVIDHLVLRKERDPARDEWHGKNAILDLCNLDEDVPILFFQDDTQIVSLKGLYNIIVDFVNTDIVHMSISGVRRVTTDAKAEVNAQKIVSQITNSKYWFNRDLHLGTTGIYKSSLFKKIGNYKIDIDEKTYDGFTSCEDFMDSLAKEKADFKYSIWPHVPCAISIWNDPRGLHALVRGDRRYGYYVPPDEKSGLYYELLTDDEYDFLMENSIPSSFLELAKPINWQYARDEKGDLRKYDKTEIRNEGPVCTFDNTVIREEKKENKVDLTNHSGFKFVKM